MAQMTLGGPSNPYLTNVANSLQTQSNQNLFQNVLPQINRGAVAVGGFGDSRNAIAQGVAAGNAQAGLDSALSNLYGNAYGQDLNFYTAQRGQDLQQQGLNQNFYLGNRGLDLNQQAQGFNQYLNALNAQMAMGQNQYNIGQQQQQAPYTQLNQWAGLMAPLTGTNVTSQNSQTTGGGLAGALGGALSAQQLLGLLLGGK